LEADADSLIEVQPGSKPLRDDRPLTLATAFLTSEKTDMDGRRLLQHWGGEFFVWSDALNRYERQVTERFRAELWEFLKVQKCRNRRGIPKPLSPTARKTNDIVQALAHECQSLVEQMPAWLDNHRPDAADIVAFKNGLLNVRDYSAAADGAAPVSVSIPPTPAWFSEIALPYNFNPAATCPAWLQFLESVLPAARHPGAIDLLQEYMGYSMTADTRHQKLLVLVGPPRCGKGTIIRALHRVVGKDNCASPTFDSLGERFGLEPLIGKRLATISDAHLGRSSDAVRILDRILQVTGEDAVSIDRKGRAALPNVRLGIRFLVGCNEMPTLPENSGALISRLLFVEFQESFIGREDLQLDSRLAAESPGIALWALRGLARLQLRGRFTVPAGAAELKNEYLRQSSPVNAFLEDCCDRGEGDDFWAYKDDVWAAWQKWADENGNAVRSRETFGKALKGAWGLSPTRVRREGDRTFIYRGLRLKFPPESPI
jgi:putative DNA primase/helicase